MRHLNLPVTIPVLSIEIMQSIIEIFANLGGAEFTVKSGIYLIQCDIEYEAESGDLGLIIPISDTGCHLESVGIKIIESGYLLSAYDQNKNLLESRATEKSNLRKVFEQISGISTQIDQKSWN